VQVIRAAASRTFCTAGSSKPIRIAMMAITTKSSIRVKAFRFKEFFMINTHFKTTAGGSTIFKKGMIVK
jgi:hypothetical protein